MKLSDPSKLVYSPHAYGPSVYMQGYFSSGSFPANMAAVWERHWAFVQASTGTPVVIGELGGWYTGRDRQWQELPVDYNPLQPLTAPCSPLQPFAAPYSPFQPLAAPLQPLAAPCSPLQPPCSPLQPLATAPL